MYTFLCSVYICKCTQIQHSISMQSRNVKHTKGHTVYYQVSLCRKEVGLSKFWPNICTVTFLSSVLWHPTEFPIRCLLWFKSELSPTGPCFRACSVWVYYCGEVWKWVPAAEQRKIMPTHSSFTLLPVCHVNGYLPDHAPAANHSG